MISAMIELLITLHVALALALILVFALRWPLRRLAGARLAFGVWLLPVVAVISVLAPGPFVSSGPETASQASQAGIAKPDIEYAAMAAPPQHVDAEPNAPPAASQSLRLWDGLVQEMIVALWGAGAMITVAILSIRQYLYLSGISPIRPAPELGARVFRSDVSVIGAGLVGLLRPKIVVPADFETRFGPAERALILAHEEEHRRAGHAQLNALAALGQVVFWMNPLAPIALRAFRLDQELACDAAVMTRANAKARTYGAALVRAQSGHPAPIGCAWRPANGLKIRIKALGLASPAALTRSISRAGLAILIAAFGAAAWAARPDIRPADSGADRISEMQSQPAAAALSRVELRGVDGRVEIIAEPRSDILVEGLASAVLTRREGAVLVVQASELNEDVCNQGGPVTQDFTLRVPAGVQIDVTGRINGRISAPSDVWLRAQGCGAVELGDVSGALTLDLDGRLDVNGRDVSGALTVQSSGDASVDLVHVGGPIEVQTSGGATTNIEALEAGGRLDLSGGSDFVAQEWSGPMQVGLSGGSRILIEDVAADRADVVVSGASAGHIEGGTLSEIRVDQAANASFFYGGQAERSHVRNRGRRPVVLLDPGELDSQGVIRTGVDPPSD